MSQGDGSAQQGPVGPRGDGRWETLSSWDNTNTGSSAVLAAVTMLCLGQTPALQD